MMTKLSQTGMNGIVFAVAALALDGLNDMNFGMLAATSLSTIGAFKPAK